MFGNDFSYRVSTVSDEPGDVSFESQKILDFNYDLIGIKTNMESHTIAESLDHAKTVNLEAEADVIHSIDTPCQTPNKVGNCHVSMSMSCMVWSTYLLIVFFFYT